MTSFQGVVMRFPLALVVLVGCGAPPEHHVALVASSARLPPPISIDPAFVTYESTRDICAAPSLVRVNPLRLAAPEKLLLPLGPRTSNRLSVRTVALSAGVRPCDVLAEPVQGATWTSQSAD